MYFIITVW